MNRKAFSIALVLLSLVAIFGIAIAQGGRRFDIDLTGSVEVPDPGDPDGTGRARIWINAGRGTITYELSVSGIVPATGAHIHRGVVGEAGPVVVPLDPPSDGTSSGTVSVDRALAREILRAPSQYYVNVHNADHPAGALRGQLAR